MMSVLYRRTTTSLAAAAALAACAARSQQAPMASAPAASAPVAPASAAAQPVAPAGPRLTVGSVAPDFALRGATRYGLLATPVRLSDYRGQTVVIAFFYKARTKG
jgi:hypothetical protein